ncbi:MAG: efflux RND transporter periplasmic adaptor subunit [Desulfuromonas sp.]|nr:MAG: efflux RND transporter periplasmic adaptor subunit [Desulfuromonas sp.]
MIRFSVTVSLLFLALMVGGLLPQGGHEEHRHLWGVEAAHAEENVQYTCGMHPFIIQDEPGICPICAMDLTPLKEGTDGSVPAAMGERTIKYWVAPMDPTYIRKEPGKSPMGMDLVPVYEGDAPTGAVISVDSVTVQNMGVRREEVTRQNIERSIRTVGLVTYEEQTQYQVNSKIGGWVEELYVNRSGQSVRQGEPLLRLYSPELVSAQQELLLALANRDALVTSPFPEVVAGAERLLDAARQRLALWDISRAQTEKLETTRQIERTLLLHSPYSGVVTEKLVTEGMALKPGMPLLRIANLARVWVNADIYESELPWVKVGAKAQVEIPYGERPTLAASVDFIYPFVEPRTRTVKARLVLDNPMQELKPEMYVNVRLEAHKASDVVAVPAEAILDSGDVQTVFVALGDGKFEPRQVKVGLYGDDGRVEIIQGLFAGEQVVVSSQFLFDSESKLREAIRKMLAPKESAPSSVSSDMNEDLFSEDDELEDLF